MYPAKVFDPVRNVVNLTELHRLAVAERPRPLQPIAWCEPSGVPSTSPSLTPVLAQAFTEVVPAERTRGMLSSGLLPMNHQSVPTDLIGGLAALPATLPHEKNSLPNLSRLRLPELRKPDFRMTEVEGSISPQRQQEYLTERGALDLILPFACQQFLRASTLKALLGMPNGTLLRRIGKRFEIVSDREEIDLEDPRQEYRLGSVSVFS